MPLAWSSLERSQPLTQAPLLHTWPWAASHAATSAPALPSSHLWTSLPTQMVPAGAHAVQPFPGVHALGQLCVDGSPPSLHVV